MPDSDDLSLVEHSDEEPRTIAPAPTDEPDPAQSIEEQQRQGWPDEPTTS